MTVEQITPPVSKQRTAALWHTLSPQEVLADLSSDAAAGLSAADAAQRLAEYGPNTVAADAPPSRLKVALMQVRDPMNLMLLGVAAVSVLIGRCSRAPRSPEAPAGWW